MRKCNDQLECFMLSETDAMVLFQEKDILDARQNGVIKRLDKNCSTVCQVLLDQATCHFGEKQSQTSARLSRK